MSQNRYRGPRLPQFLGEVHDGRVSKTKRSDRPRGDRRKAEREHVKVARAKSTVQPKRASGSRHQVLPLREAEPLIEENSESGLSEDDQSRSNWRGVDRGSPDSITDRTALETTGESQDADVSLTVTSKPAKARLERDDAEIAALEKKLGLRGKGKASKKIDDDGLDWIMDGLGESSGEESATKRRRPEYQQWLRDKRRKTDQGSDEAGSTVSDQLGNDAHQAKLKVGSRDHPDTLEELSSDEAAEDQFAGFDSEEHDATPARRVRENPYVALTTSGVSAPKYVPPSLRSAPTPDEALVRLRRHLQGLLNRLSESNMQSILQSIEQAYSQNPRQLVSSTIVDLLIGLISDSATLNDAFIVLHAAFAVGVYRFVGKNFGAQLLESIVKAFDENRGDSQTQDKQALNLMAFLSTLYVFQAVGCEIMFDYIRTLLEDFSEVSTELILRIIRVAGPQLRQDDPSSLKDIVLLLQQEIARIGAENLSVRTKFMIETIHNLKNNRVKTTSATSSAPMAENMRRMKQILRSLDSRTQSAPDPLRITLADIRDSEKKGKWWLVGASYQNPSKMADAPDRDARRPPSDDVDSDVGSAISQDVDLDQLARAQGMNTDVRRAIFVSLVGAVDYQHAHLRVTKLNLKNKQQLEIPRVILHCVGSEPAYNHFYTLVGREFCRDRRLRKAYGFALLDTFQRMGEDGPADAAAADDDGPDDPMPVQKIYNLAKFYAWLIADRALRLTILRTLDFTRLQPPTQVFVEVLLTAVLVGLRKKTGRGGFEHAVKEAFNQLHTRADMVADFRYYLSTVLVRADLAMDHKEKRAVVQGCRIAVEALSTPPNGVDQDEEDSESA